MRTLLRREALVQGGGLSYLSKGIFNPSIAHPPRQGMFITINNLNVTAWGTSITCGIRNNSGDAVLYGIQTDASGNVDVVENGSVVASDVATLSLSTNYDLAIALDDNKIAHYFLYDSGQSEWRRIYVGTFATSAALVYANDTTVGATYTTTEEAFGTGMPYENETINIASPASQSGNLSDADFIAQVTAPSSGVFQFDFRKEDATNYWRLEYSVTGNTYRVYEVVNGSSTTRITYTGAAGSEALFMQAYGNTIKIWSAGALRGTYTSANNFLRETAWAIASAGTGTSGLIALKSYTRNEAGEGIELVTNGTFDTDLTGWVQDGTPSTFEATGGRAHIITDAINEGIRKNNYGSGMSGVYHNYSFDYEIIAQNINVYFDTGMARTYSLLTGSGSKSGGFISSSAAPSMLFRSENSGGEFYIDNVSVKRQLFSTDMLGNKLNQGVS